MNVLVAGIVMCILHNSVQCVEVKPKAPKAKTTPDPKTTTSAPVVKEKSQKELLGAFGFFGSSKSKDKSASQNDTIVTATVPNNSPKVAADPPVDKHTKAPPNTAEQQCSSFDMCATMNGICNHGKCVHTDPTCMNDIKCNCNSGYTGQFCSTAIKDIPEITTTIEPTTSSTIATPTTTTAKHTTTTHVATTKTAKNNGKQHVNGNIDTNALDKHSGTASGNLDSSAIGSGASATNSKVAVIEKSIDNTVKVKDRQGNAQKGISAALKSDQGVDSSSQVSKKSAKETISIEKSYRKGPEASFVADNSPIKLNTTVKPHSIRTGKVSIISTLQDIVTFATVSVKNTFINVVKHQTPASKSSMVNTGDSAKTTTMIGKTTKPEKTTQAAFTKIVIIDSSKNMTVNATSNIGIKKTDTRIVKKTNGSVGIENKSVDTIAHKTSNMINTSNKKDSDNSMVKKTIPKGADSKNVSTKKQNVIKSKKSDIKNTGTQVDAKARSNSKSPKNGDNKKATIKNKNSVGQKSNNGTRLSANTSKTAGNNIEKLVAITKNKLSSAATSS